MTIDDYDRDDKRLSYSHGFGSSETLAGYGRAALSTHLPELLPGTIDTSSPVCQDTFRYADACVYKGANVYIHMYIKQKYRVQCIVIYNMIETKYTHQI